MMAFGVLASGLIYLGRRKSPLRFRNRSNINNIKARDENRRFSRQLGDWLRRSTYHGFKSCVQLLLAADVELEFEQVGKEPEGLQGTPLWVASEYFRLDIAAILVKRRADLTHVKSRDGCPIGEELLIQAVYCDHLSLANEPLGRAAKVDDSDRPDPFFVAINSRNHIEMAGLLLDHGASPNVLAQAISVSSYPLETAAMLIDRGADVNSLYTAKTTLDISIPHDEPLARLVVDHGAEIFGHNVRRAVKDSMRLPFVQLIIDKAKSGPEEAGLIALDAAASCGNVKFVQYFLARGVKPKGLNFKAVSRGFVDIVRMLLNASRPIRCL